MVNFQSRRALPAVFWNRTPAALACKPPLSGAGTPITSHPQPQPHLQALPLLLAPPPLCLRPL